MPPLSDDDEALVRVASELVASHGDGRLHTVAAAARARDGRVFAGLNVYHFTGGPCAELVVLGMAASQGARDLVSVVAVGDAGRGIIPPCGRCRQVMFDYTPQVQVILSANNSPKIAPLTELLPEASSYRSE